MHNSHRQTPKLNTSTAFDGASVVGESPSLSSASKLALLSEPSGLIARESDGRGGGVIVCGGLRCGWMSEVSDGVRAGPCGVNDVSDGVRGGSPSDDWEGILGGGVNVLEGVRDSGRDGGSEGGREDERDRVP